MKYALIFQEHTKSSEVHSPVFVFKQMGRGGKLFVKFLKSPKALVHSNGCCSTGKEFPLSIKTKII